MLVFIKCLPCVFCHTLKPPVNTYFLTFSEQFDYTGRIPVFQPLWTLLSPGSPRATARGQNEKRLSMPHRCWEVSIPCVPVCPILAWSSQWVFVNFAKNTEDVRSRQCICKNAYKLDLITWHESRYKVWSFLMQFPLLITKCLRSGIYSDTLDEKNRWFEVELWCTEEFMVYNFGSWRQGLAILPYLAWNPLWLHRNLSAPDSLPSDGVKGMHHYTQIMENKKIIDNTLCTQYSISSIKY